MSAIAAGRRRVTMPYYALFGEVVMDGIVRVEPMGGFDGPATAYYLQVHTNNNRSLSFRSRMNSLCAMSSLVVVLIRGGFGADQSVSLF